MNSGNLTGNAVDAALAGRPYRFREHGLSDSRRPRRSRAPSRRRVSQQRRSRPCDLGSPGDFSLRDFGNPERLHAVFRILQREGGHGAGEDDLTYDDFAPTEIYSVLRHISAALVRKSYRSHPSKLVPIPKGDGGTRDLLLQRITDRVVAKALQIALDSFWRSRLPGIGRDVWQVYAEMQHAMRQHRAFVVAVDDIKNCFPNTPLDEVMRCHRQHISQPDLLWLIETIVRGHEGREHTVGLDQGSPYSPTAMELLLHTHLDARLGTGTQGPPLLFRYVDNLTFVCSSEHEGHQALEVARDLLAEQGFTLKGEDGPPRDIREADCQQPILGLIPRWQNGQLTFSIPEPAFGNLETGLIEALTHREPTKTATAVATGWINSVGPALVRKVVPEVVDRVCMIARRCGFLELDRKGLFDAAHGARSRWLWLCERRGGRDGV